MNTITNRQTVCDVLMEKAKDNKDIIVMCSDSRGSASLAAFAAEYPEQFVEMGIAEQNLVSVAAGLASCGKKVVAASPACFLSTRSYEQAKIDVAYSENDVLLLGISGGISYGALGMSHHSCQDIAAFCALPGMRVYLPSDRHLTKRLTEELLKDNKPSYVRVSRNATQDVYDENMEFELDKAILLKEGKDVGIIATGEMVPYAKAAAAILETKGISASVLDMYCLKPLDEKSIIKIADETGLIVTVEEHSQYGGLGSLVSQVVTANKPVRVVQLALPDEHLITGTSVELFKHYGIDSEGIADSCEKAVKG